MPENHVVKVVAGTVKLYRSNGVLLRSFSQGAVSAVVQGDEVHVSTKNGEVRVYGINGQLKRTI